MLLVSLGDLRLEPLIRIRVQEIAFHVVNPPDHPIPDFWIDRRRSDLGNAFGQEFPKAFRVEVVSRESYNRKLLRQEVFLNQIAKSRDQLAPGQVTRRAKNRHHARSG